jgi:hypothetical protein
MVTTLKDKEASAPPAPPARSARLVPKDDRLLRPIPVLDFIAAHLDVAATVACLDRTFCQDMRRFRAQKESVGSLRRLLGVSGCGSDAFASADTAFECATRFYSGLVHLDLRQCCVTKPLLLLLPDRCPKLKRLRVDLVHPPPTFELNPCASCCPQTINQLKLRLPKLDVLPRMRIMHLRLIPSGPELIILENCNRSVRGIYDKLRKTPRGKSCPADAQLIFDGRLILDDEKLCNLRHKEKPEGENWSEPLLMMVVGPPHEEAAAAALAQAQEEAHD